MAELRLTQALDAYRKGAVTLSRGAEMAGLWMWDWMARLDQAQADLHYGPEDLTADLAAFNRTLG
jgi:predicted HTH domain antitoxin